MTAHALMYVDNATFYNLIAKADDQHHYSTSGVDHTATGRRDIAARKTWDGSRIPSAETARSGDVVSHRIDLATDTGDRVRYADVMVERLGATEDRPSPPSRRFCWSMSSLHLRKSVISLPSPRIFGLASLQACIVVSQDEPLCYVSLGTPMANSGVNRRRSKVAIKSSKSLRLASHSRSLTSIAGSKFEGVSAISNRCPRRQQHGRVWEWSGSGLPCGLGKLAVSARHQRACPKCRHFREHDGRNARAIGRSRPRGDTRRAVPARQQRCAPGHPGCRA